MGKGKITGKGLLALGLLVVCMVMGITRAEAQAPTVGGQLCEHVQNPMGIHTQTPSLSWKIKDAPRGFRPYAFQVLVASSVDKLNPQEADLWNSGRTVSPAVWVTYQGKPLASRQVGYWKVLVWEKGKGKPLESPVAFWEMGLLQPEDWQGAWISAVPRDTVPPTLPAPYFRKAFDLGSPVQSARLYIAGLGFFEASLNGKKAGDHEMPPVMTRFDRQVQYVVYDVTTLLQQGANALGVVLGNGWYNQHTRTAWDFDRAPWRDSPTLRCQLEVTTADGNKMVVSSDDSWLFTQEGPITFNGIHNGEHYDARKELGAWDMPGYAAEGWKTPVLVDGPAGRLVAQLMPPSRVVRVLKPASVKAIRPGVWMVDAGENITGWVAIKVNGPEGAELSFRYGERLLEDGMLDQKELSRFIWTGETQTDRYTLKGQGDETWRPRFVFHGFQYIEVQSSAPEVALMDLTVEVVHTDLPVRGTFTSSNAMFNQVQANLVRSFLGNYHGYPTDCPHREKMGWTGDAQLVAEAGLFNFDILAAYRKWIEDFIDEQRENGQIPGIIPTSGWGYTLGRTANRERGYGPQWEGAFIEIPWQMYLFSGDTSLLKNFYPGMKQYLNYLTQHAEGHLLDFGIDDHKQLVKLDNQGYLASAHYYHYTRIMEKVAAMLGDRESQTAWSLQARAIQDAFNQKYYDPEKGSYYVGGQTPLAVALYMGLVAEDQVDKVLGMFRQAIAEKDGHVDGGVVGTKAILNTMLRFGMEQELYAMADKRTFPGWGYWMVNGATTLYQNWDMSQSLNHIMFGTIGDFFYKGLLGLQPMEATPGFQVFMVAPMLNSGLEWARGSHVSPFGEIQIGWKKEAGSWVVDLVVPAGSTAHLHLPVPIASTLLVDGKRWKGKHPFITRKGTAHHYLVRTGQYRFTVSLPKS
jgi:alpha-L-rhamnosidase